MKLVKNYQDFVNETYEASLAEPTVDLQFSLLTLELLAVRDQAHLFHWQTKSYEEHIAFGDFYDDFIDKVDVLMENIMAKQDRPQFSKGSITLVGYSQQAVEEFSQRVKVTLSEKLPLAVPTEGNEEIYNIVEELKALVNKLDYLLTLK